MMTYLRPRLLLHNLSLAMLLSWVPVAGQEQRAISLLVVDAASGTPIPRAWVEVEGRPERIGVDEDGRFSLWLAPGGYRLHVHAFGFESAARSLEVPSAEGVVISLRPRPIELEGVEVEVRGRLVQRRRAVARPVRAMDRQEIMESNAPTAFDALRQRYLRLVPCGAGGDADCIRYQGGLRIPIVCIDERVLPGGLRALRNYPVSSMYAMEVFENGVMVRVYTTWFMDRVMEDRMRIQPTLRRFAC